jgi:hypothetical protein
MLLFFQVFDFSSSIWALHSLTDTMFKPALTYAKPVVQTVKAEAANTSTSGALLLMAILPHTPAPWQVIDLF